MTTFASIAVSCCFVAIVIIQTASAFGLRSVMAHPPAHSTVHSWLMSAKSMRQQDSGPKNSQSDLAKFLATTQLLVVCPVSILNLEQISSLKKTLVGGPHSTVVSESKLLE